MNNAMFYIIWLLLCLQYENVSWHEMYGIALEKVEVTPPILNPFEESESSQSVSWSKDRKKSEDNDNVQR